MARKKKLGKLAVAMSERQFIGPMPVWQGMSSKGQLIDFYNWCSVAKEPKDAKKYLIDYLNENKRPVGEIEALSDEEFQACSWVGWTAFLLSDGRMIDVEAMQRFNTKIDALMAKSRIVKPPMAKRNVIYLDDKMEKGLGLCEELFDKIWNERDFTQETFDSFKDRGIDQKVALQYLPILIRNVDEIDQATDGKHPEVAEGYASYDVKELRYLASLFVRYSDSLLALTQVAAPKKPRKPREIKAKPAEKQVKSLKYCQKDDKYGVSIDPRKIVGAAELWMFNVVYRKLTVLRAADKSGLTVKGSTVYGFDEDSSKTKKVRKPEILLKEIMSGGKVQARQTFDGLKTTVYPAKGRVGEDTILLRVF